MNRFRWIGLTLCLLWASVVQAQTPLELDEQALKGHKPPIDPKGLVKWFQDRSIRDDDAARLPALVKKLDSDVFRVRETAYQELKASGSRSLPFLRAGLATNPPYETKLRAERCIAEIESQMTSEPVAAAARILASRKDPGAAE